jgi:hypothetical protein
MQDVVDVLSHRYYGPDFGVRENELQTSVVR